MSPLARRLTLAALEPWLEMRFDPARGPGGQNVNKVSSRATLLLDFQACPVFSSVERARLAERLANRLARDGRLRVVAQQARSQADNRAHAGERLLALLTEALHVPKTRHATRPTAGSHRRRLTGKRLRGATKQQRKSPPAGGD